MGIVQIRDLGRIQRSLDYSAEVVVQGLLRTPEHVTLARTIKDGRGALGTDIATLLEGLGGDATDAVSALSIVDGHLEQAAAALGQRPETRSKLAHFMRRPIWDDRAAGTHLAKASQALTGARAVLDQMPGVENLANLAARHAAEGATTSGARTISDAALTTTERVLPEAVERWAGRHGDALQSTLRGAWRTFGRPATRLSSHGTEHIPKDGPMILAATHGSDLDTLFMTDGMPRNVRMLANHKLMSRFGDGTIARNSGGFPIDNTGGRAAEGLAIADEILETHERPVLWFWEGRGVAGDYIGEPKIGAARTAIKNQVPIVPVGSYGTKPKYTRFEPVDRKVVVYGSPIETAGMPDTDAYAESLAELVAQRADGATRQAESIARGIPRDNAALAYAAA